MKNNELVPLAERCRPKTFDEYMGQRHLTGDGKILSASIANRNPFSMILWGEPGCGKTTLARILASTFNMPAHFLSAISAGVADVRKVIDEGKANREKNLGTLLFLDEIHRFNKAQQDAVLGAVESGDIILIGATTENPSFNVISPLLSRTRILKLKPLDDTDMMQIFETALHNDEILVSKKLTFESGVKENLIHLARGDARRMLNLLEIASTLAKNGAVTDDLLKSALKDEYAYYDKKGDRHYDTISAFIKSMRGSDPNAAVYYLARMLAGGEDAVFIARRMVIFASEDVGNASPHALSIATSALLATQQIGLPEAEIILSHCAVFLASSPKSNASYMALSNAKKYVDDFAAEIPLHIRNAPTSMMSDMGYGKGYKYPHDFPGHFVPEQYLPDTIKDEVFYHPSDEGSEHALKERLMRLWPKKYPSTVHTKGETNE